jgi:hypothetical protein
LLFANIQRDLSPPLVMFAFVISKAYTVFALMDISLLQMANDALL